MGQRTKRKKVGQGSPVWRRLFAAAVSTNRKELRRWLNENPDETRDSHLLLYCIAPTSKTVFAKLVDRHLSRYVDVAAADLRGVCEEFDHMLGNKVAPWATWTVGEWVEVWDQFWAFDNGEEVG